MDARAGRWTSLALPGVLALVPFEPRSPTLALGPFHFTVLEGVALLAMGGLAWRAGVRRATAGSEYPNLGAACIAYGLLSAVAWAARRRWSATPGVLLAAPFALGLLYTYSRGALVALAAALMVAAAVLADADRAGA